jgi:GNAT superfamily N-acetyltransferase
MTAHFILPRIANKAASTQFSRRDITMDAIDITGYVPGVLGWATHRQATYYHTHWGLGLYFEVRVATELADLLSRLDPVHDGVWVAHLNGEIVGTIFIDGHEASTQGARLRWFFIDPRYQGLGIGNRLMQEAMTFCQQAGFRRVYLTTFAGLNTARHLYEKFGFKLCHEEDGTHLTGNSALVEQVLECLLPSDADQQRDL